MPPRQAARGRARRRSRTACARSLNDAEAKSAEVGAHMVMIGILPTLARRPPEPGDAERQPALQAAQRADPRAPAARTSSIDIAGRRSGCDTTADSIMPEAACTSTQFHVQTSARSSFAGVLERLPGDRRRPARASAPTRRTCSARSCGARPGSRCSSRPPTPAARSSRRRACGRGCGSASAGSPRSSTCSRRTSATSRRCCRSPTTRTRSRCSRPAARRSSPSCGCTTARSTAGTGRSTTSPTGVPHLRVENRVLAGRPDRRRHDGQRRLLLRAGPHAGRERAAAVVADVVQRGGGELPRRGRSTASTRRSTGPASAQVRATELVLRRLLPMAHEGLAAWGVDGADERPAARHHRAALPDRAQRRRAGSSTGCAERAGDGPATTRCGATLLEYRERMHTNEPVHTWDGP